MDWNMRRVQLLACGMMLGLSCSDDDKGPTARGNLGNGDFRYACAGDGANCEEFPDCIARGSRIELTYRLDPRHRNHWREVIRVAAASEDFFTANTGWGFQATQVGTAAMLAQTDEQLVDFVNFRLVEPEGLNVDWLDPNTFPLDLEVGPDADDPSLIHLTVGTSIDFVAHAVLSGCLSAGGRLPVSFENEDPNIIQVTDQGAGVYQVVGRREGESMLTVRQESFSETFLVRVARAPEPEPGPIGPMRIPPEPPGDTETDTDGDTDVDTDTDTDVDTSAETVGETDGGAETEDATAPFAREEVAR